MKARKEVKTEIRIQAPPDRVWSILVDFDAYGSWNPFIHSIAGQAIQGQRIVARMVPPGKSGMTFKPELLKVTPKRELRWLGHLLIPGLFDGEHIFELHDNGDGSTTFVQRELFSGILIPLFRKMLGENTRAGFEAMNAALKSRAEKTAAKV